jgi:hypothetical protein
LITSLSSATRVCGETYPRTFLTSIIGGRIDRSDNGHRAVRKKLGLRLSGNTERSSQTLYSVACTTSISTQHDTSGRVLTRCTFMRGGGPARALAPPERPRSSQAGNSRHLPFVNFVPLTPKTPDRIFAPYSFRCDLQPVANGLCATSRSPWMAWHGDA